MATYRYDMLAEKINCVNRADRSIRKAKFRIQDSGFRIQEPGAGSREPEIRRPIS
jgi:hypothetical protein